MERAASSPRETPETFDVAVIGGAIAGAAAALLLLRERPSLRVLIVEKQPVFDAKVGEATTEMSGMFLTRRLALWQHLELEHLPKEGLRYWFHNGAVSGHADASETGAYQRSNVPSFQLRRDALDEHVLALAKGAGAEVWRPARAVDVVLDREGEGAPAEGPDSGTRRDRRHRRHRLSVEIGRERREVTCRWLLDASGRATFLGRRLGLIGKNEEHPTSAVWCRWENVRHLDDFAVLSERPFAAGNVSSRRLATNHYMGRGYWVWKIPLGHGETSIGLVFDRRLVDLDLAGSARAANYEAFLRAIPPLAELLDGARPRLDDLRAYSTLAYATERYAGPGWALLGDAAAFLDPYYSPGLDHVGFSVEATVALVLAELAGEDIAARLEEHNATFLRSYWRFFRAIYQDKYFYMGEHDLLSAATLLDTAQYYLFVVIPAYRIFKRFHWMPVLGPKQAFVSYHLMRIANRRFVALAERRLRAGEAGKRNRGRRIVLRFDLGWSPARMVLRGLKLWAWAELDGLRLALARPFRRAAPAANAAAIRDRLEAAAIEPPRVAP